MHQMFLISDGDNGTMSIKCTRFPGYAKPGDNVRSKKKLILFVLKLTTASRGVVWRIYYCYGIYRNKL